MPEYEPPGLPGTGRVLRPAEIGILMRERATDDDVSATIVDLAIRRYISIEEVDPREPGDRADYRLTRLNRPDSDLQPYERRLLSAIFDGKVAAASIADSGDRTALLSELEGAFWMDWDAIRNSLYEHAVRVDGLFVRDPERDRSGISSFGSSLALLSFLAGIGLGATHGVALVFVPSLLGAVGLSILGHLLPARTGLGREMLRRALGFKLFLETVRPEELVSEDGDVALWNQYLPYAMVFGSGGAWADKFDGLRQVGRLPAWYIAAHPKKLAPLAGLVSGLGGPVSRLLGGQTARPEERVHDATSVPSNKQE